ncbi:hypothetical protein F0U61_51350 [Archangium violaceum]|uniref:PPC domain-containing protein n=1 Tax=Archangium violaceum TaxID=83451 RepID=UPI002B2E4CF5|nr:hypothetical protein F0U61_51350 [Archangium violaceum]
MVHPLIRTLTLVGLVLSAAACGAPPTPSTAEADPTLEAGDRQAVTQSLADCIPLPLTNGVPATNISANTNEQRCYSLEVPLGATQLFFDLSGSTGDADLYVKFGAVPGLYSYDCRPLQLGSTESCSVPHPGIGTYYVMINAYSTYSGAQLVGRYSILPSGGVLTNGVESAQYSGTALTMRCFTLDVPSGRASLVFNQVGKEVNKGDADLYVKLGAIPTTSNYDCRPYQSGSTETCTISNPAEGRWYACSYGFSTYSTVTMKGTYSPSP